jgi:hypothetical protein
MIRIKMITSDLRGATGGAFHCPVARALRRHFAADWVSCGFWGASIRGANGSSRSRHFRLNPATTRRIEAFEEGCNLKAFKLPATIILTEIL